MELPKDDVKFETLHHNPRKNNGSGRPAPPRQVHIFEPAQKQCEGSPKRIINKGLPRVSSTYDAESLPSSNGWQKLEKLRAVDSQFSACGFHGLLGLLLSVLLLL